MGLVVWESSEYEGRWWYESRGYVRLGLIYHCGFLFLCHCFISVSNFVYREPSVS